MLNRMKTKTVALSIIGTKKKEVMYEMRFVLLCDRKWERERTEHKNTERIKTCNASGAAPPKKNK